MNANRYMSVTHDELRMLAYAMTFTERFCGKGYSASDYALMDRMKKECQTLFGEKYRKPESKR